MNAHSFAHSFISTEKKFTLFSQNEIIACIRNMKLLCASVRIVAKIGG